MKNLLILFLLILTNLLPAQNKERDPKWLMPLYFRDANGDRDTVYFGYDPEASTYGESDTILGEEWIRIDTSKFNIYLWNYPSIPGGAFPLINDTVKKVDIRSGYLGAYIGFCKGNLPITMKWVDSLLYSASLPFPDLSPRPRARIDLTCSDYSGYGSCNPIDGPPLSLTDYPAPEIHFPVTDSIVLGGPGPYSPSSVIINLELTLVRHNYEYVGLDKEEHMSLVVYPNPFTDQITIRSMNGNTGTVRILSMTGSCFISDTLYKGQQVMDVSELSRGLYLLELKTNKDILIQKIVKIE